MGGRYRKRGKNVNLREKQREREGGIEGGSERERDQVGSYLHFYS